MFGCSDEIIADQFHYYGPTEPADPVAVAIIVADIAMFGYTLVVIDSIGEAFGAQGINEDRDNEVALVAPGRTWSPTPYMTLSDTHRDPSTTIIWSH